MLILFVRFFAHFPPVDLSLCVYFRRVTVLCKLQFSFQFSTFKERHNFYRYSFFFSHSSRSIYLHSLISTVLHWEILKCERTKRRYAHSSPDNEIEFNLSRRHFRPAKLHEIERKKKKKKKIGERRARGESTHLRANDMMATAFSGKRVDGSVVQVDIHLLIAVLIATR